MNLTNNVKYTELSEEQLSLRLKTRMRDLEINYLEMSLQIGVSLSTFKRMVNRPHQAKYGLVSALIRELGGSVCIDV